MQQPRIPGSPLPASTQNSAVPLEGRRVGGSAGGEAVNRWHGTAVGNIEWYRLPLEVGFGSEGPLEEGNSRWWPKAHTYRSGHI